MRRTHNRSDRFGGHAKQAYYCSCGRVVWGNGGKQHFKVEGHKKVTHNTWAALPSEGSPDSVSD